MDQHHASWILEFLLRQPIPECLAKEVLAELLNPPPDHVDPDLKKTILLRRIRFHLADRRLSEEVLLSLELVEEIDRSLGEDDDEPSSPAMSAAYCAVAVECTVMALRRQGGEGFFEAVRRIWARRVADLERSPAARRLGSDRLSEWRRDMEKAVVNPIVRASLLRQDTESRAFETLGEYLKRALEDIGPPLLEVAAREICVEGKGLGNGGKRHKSHVPDGSVAVELGRPSAELSGEGTTRVAETELRVESKSTAQEASSSPVVHAIDEFHRLPTPEVNKVKEALKSSCVDLQKSVIDPLPDAVEKAAGIQSSILEKPTVTKASEQNENRADVNEPGPVNKGAQLASKEGTVADKKIGLGCNGMKHPSLMDRNPTACTYEWGEDSIESPSEKSSDSSERIHLPTPRRRIVSPLKLPEVRKFVRRRKVKRWNPLEEDTLRDGVKEHGKGNWKLILQSYPEVFEDRTEVDLKDKWRNMTRSGI